MRINKNLVLQENRFFPSTQNKTLLIRILFERLSEVDETNTLTIPFKEIREGLGTDIRQKFVNRLLDEILETTFTYNGKEYPYIASYKNNSHKRSYAITFPKETISVWLDDAISYDFQIIKDLKSNKSSMILYEYLMTGATSLSFHKFYDIFCKDGYNFHEKRKALERAIENINENSDVRINVSYNRDLNSFLIKKE